MKRFLKPWQSMPSRIISMALDHAKQNTDFDHQLAFLLLDVGVETALKTYLVNKNPAQDIGHIGILDLIKRVGEELSKDNLQIDLTEITYFHRIRNKLYHQGDGVKPTEENLEMYSRLAKELVKVLLNVDLQEIDTSNLIVVTRWEQETRYTIAELTNELTARLRYFQESCSFVIEKIHPKFATREFSGNFRKIENENLYEKVYDDEYSLDMQRINIDRAETRVLQFNQLFGKQISSDQEFVDYLLGDINHLYVRISLDQLSEDSDEDWDKYTSIIDQIKQFPKSNGESPSLDSQKILEEFDDIFFKIKNLQDKLDKWGEDKKINIRDYVAVPNYSTLRFTCYGLFTD